MKSKPKLEERMIQDRLIQDCTQLANIHQIMVQGDIVTCLDAMQGLGQAHALHDELTHALVGIRGRLSERERDLLARISKARSEINRLETDLKNLQKKQTTFRADLVEIQFGSQRRQWAEDSMLSTTRNRMNYLSERQSEVDTDLNNVKREIDIAQTSIEREKHRWFPNKRNLNELQARETHLSDQESVLKDQRAKIQQEQNQLNKKLN